MKNLFTRSAKCGAAQTQIYPTPDPPLLGPARPGASVSARFLGRRDGLLARGGPRRRRAPPPVLASLAPCEAQQLPDNSSSRTPPSSPAQALLLGGAEDGRRPLPPPARASTCVGGRNAFNVALRPWRRSRERRKRAPRGDDHRELSGRRGRRPRFKAGDGI